MRTIGERRRTDRPGKKKMAASEPCVNLQRHVALGAGLCALVEPDVEPPKLQRPRARVSPCPGD
jgi:hypothetical protein